MTVISSIQAITPAFSELLTFAKLLTACQPNVGK
jgi:hypothetical protein